jgi:alkylhydroperoxidase family enzyme
VLEDYRTAPIDEKLRARLGVLEKLTKAPGTVDGDDARRVLDAGVSRDAFIDALHVQAMFAFITRCADAFGFEIPPDAGFVSSAKSLLRFGYKL